MGGEMNKVFKAKIIAQPYCPVIGCGLLMLNYKFKYFQCTDPGHTTKYKTPTIELEVLGDV